MLVEEYDLEIEVEGVADVTEPQTEGMPGSMTGLAGAIRALPLPVVFVLAITLLSGVMGLLLGLASLLDSLDFLTSPLTGLPPAFVAEVEGLRGFLLTLLVIALATAVLDLVAAGVVLTHRVVGWSLLVFSRLWAAFLPIVLYQLGAAISRSPVREGWTEQAGFADWTLLIIQLGVLGLLFTTPVVRWLGWMVPAGPGWQYDRSAPWRTP